MLRTFQGDVSSLQDIYTFSLQRPTQALLGACGLVDVLSLLLQSAIQVPRSPASIPRCRFLSFSFFITRV